MLLRDALSFLRPQRIFSWFSILFFVACLSYSAYHFFGSSASQIAFVQGLQRCAQNTNTDIALVGCTHEVVATELQAHSAASLLNEIATSSIPKKYAGCHGVAHIIGEETYVKLGDVEKAVNECTDSCDAGCLHGVVAGAVKAEYGSDDPGADIAHMDLAQIEKIGIKYCTIVGLCHGMGHILYYAAEDFQKASEGCDMISKHYPHEMCITGVFMQGIGDLRDSLVMDDSQMPSSIKPSDDYTYPCDTVSPQYQHGCFLYLPLYQSVSFDAHKITDPVAKFKLAKNNCLQLGEPARSYCFEGMAQFNYVYVSPVNGDYVEPTSVMCEGLPTSSDQKSCVIGYVSVLRGYDMDTRAYRTCSTLHSSELQTLCYMVNFEIFDPKITPTVEEFCKNSASKDACTGALSTYESNRATIPNYRFGLYGESL